MQTFVAAVDGPGLQDPLGPTHFPGMFLYILMQYTNIFWAI